MQVKAWAVLWPSSRVTTPTACVHEMNFPDKKAKSKEPKKTKEHLIEGAEEKKREKEKRRKEEEPFLGNYQWHSVDAGQARSGFSLGPNILVVEGRAST